MLYLKDKMVLREMKGGNKVKSRYIIRAFAIIALLLCFSPLARATTWYVDGTNGYDSDTDVYGTAAGDSAWKTIVYAVTNRSGAAGDFLDSTGDSVIAGDIISVAAGTYEETGIIYVDTAIHIQGASAATVLVSVGWCSTEQFMDTDCVFLFTDNAFATGTAKPKLSGMTISGRVDANDTTCADSALIIVEDGADGVEIDNCILDCSGDTTLIALFLPETDTFTFTNNTVYLDSGDTCLDFHVTSDSPHYIMGTIWEEGGDNEMADTDYCADTIIVTDNTFYASSDTNLIMLLGACNYVTIEDNTISKGGIQLNVSGNPIGENYFRFIDNTMGDSQTSGITFDMTALLIQENPRDYGTADISDSGLLNLTVTGNNFYNYDTGICFASTLENLDIQDTHVLIMFNNFANADAAGADSQCCDTAIVEQIVSDSFMYVTHNYYGTSDTPVGRGTDVYTGVELVAKTSVDSGAALDMIAGDHSDTGLRFDPWSGSKIGDAAVAIITADTDTYVPDGVSGIVLDIDIAAGASVQVVVTEYAAAPKPGFVTSWTTSEAYRDVFFTEQDVVNLDHLEVKFAIPNGVQIDPDTPIYHWRVANNDWSGCDSTYSSGGYAVACLGYNADGTQTIPDTGLLSGLIFGCKGSLIPGAAAAADDDDDDDEGSSALFKCFIATACYGTPTAREVKTLCKFRDEYLLANSVGRVLVGTYYTVSPPVAEFISRHPAWQKAVRMQLKPLVWLSEKLVSDKE